MQLENPEGTSPFEVAERLLRVAPEHLNNTVVVAPLELVHRWARAHRRFQQSARRAIHGIRTFINVDFDVIMTERKCESLHLHVLLQLPLSAVLDKTRQELDYAKYDARAAAKTPELVEQRNAELSRARLIFDRQLAKANVLKQIFELDVCSGQRSS